MTLETQTEPTVTRGPGHDERLAHLVLKDAWPVALCGVTVSDFFGRGAPAMDRCHDCIKIASTRKLGRPGWAAQ